MNKNFLLPLLATLGLALGACQKQSTEAKRNAEIERQVQQRLDAEHRASEQQKLTQRQADLDAREHALAEKENRTVPTTAPVATAAPTVGATIENDRDAASYATFYRKLDPYGEWMETSDYGFVFQPRQANQSRDWRPYTNGHWVYTDAGWTWISDEQFGWATYHYGRWIRLRSVGWVWVPGEQWAPAWVSWRKGSDYVGWAPLPPEAQFDRQTGIRNWADNYYDIGPEQYAFVRANDFGAKVSARVVVPTQQNVTIITQTTNITNITYNNSVIVDRGPSYDDFRNRSSQPIERFRLERTQDPNVDRPVFRGQVVTLPTADFRTVERATRPPRVSQTIAQPVVERGWSGIQDAQAAQKARNKMQAEATPPPNAPPQRFVRPERPVIPPHPAATSVATPATVVPAATPVATPAKPDQLNRPSAKPHPPVTTSPVQVVPTSAPNDMTTPTAPTPPASAQKNRRPGAGGAATQEEKRQQRQEAQAQRRAEREQQMSQRRANKLGRPQTSSPDQTPATTPGSPSPAAIPAETPAASPTPAASIGENAGTSRRERRAARRAPKSPADADASPSPGTPQP